MLTHILIVANLLILRAVGQAILVLFKLQTGALSNIMTTEWAGVLCRGMRKTVLLTHHASKGRKPLNI